MKIGLDLRALLGRAWFDSGTGSSEAPAGVAGYVFNILDQLTRLDTENEYLLFFNSFKKPHTEILSEILERSNVELRIFGMPNKLFDRTAKFMQWPKVDSLLGGVDVFYSPHIGITPLSSNTKRVITIHDLSFEIYPEFFPLRKRYWHWSQDVRRTCEMADAIVAVSEYTRRDIIEIYKIDPQKVHTVYSGFSGITATDFNLDKKQKNIENKYALYVGTLEPRKNVVSLIEAFDLLKTNQNSQVSNLRLVIAGGKGWLYKDIEKVLRQSRFKEDIIVKGYVSEKEKWQLLRNAALFVFPSYYEGFGFPVLEALSVGTPVVTSNNSSLSEIAGDNAILIDPYNIRSIADGMLEALENPLTETQIANISSLVTNRYSWEESGKSVLRILKNL